MLTPNCCSLADCPKDSSDDPYTDRMEQYWMAPHLDILHLIHLGCVNGVIFYQEKIVMVVLKWE